MSPPCSPSTIWCDSAVVLQAGRPQPGCLPSLCCLTLQTRLVREFLLHRVAAGSCGLTQESAQHRASHQNTLSKGSCCPFPPPTDLTFLVSSLVTSHNSGLEPLTTEEDSSFLGHKLQGQGEREGKAGMTLGSLDRTPSLNGKRGNQTPDALQDPLKPQMCSSRGGGRRRLNQGEQERRWGSGPWNPSPAAATVSSPGWPAGGGGISPKTGNLCGRNEDDAGRTHHLPRALGEAGEATARPP